LVLRTVGTNSGSAASVLSGAAVSPGSLVPAGALDPAAASVLSATSVPCGVVVEGASAVTPGRPNM
jgi:hypothetical protein